MPKVEAGAAIVPIEELLKEPPLTLEWVHECNCLIEYEPVVAGVEAKGVRVDIAIGVGSLICMACTPPLPHYTLTAPIWARAARITGTCPASGDEKLLEELSRATGVSFEPRSPEEVLREGGVIALPRGLHFEPREGVCGRVRPYTPLHPLTAPLAQEPEECIEEAVEPVGGVWRSGLELAEVRGTVIAYRYTVLGGRVEALLLAARPSREAKYVRLGYALGALYACAAREA